MKLLKVILLVFVATSVFSQQQVEFEKKNFPNDKDGYKAALKEYEAGVELYEAGPFQYKNALRHLKLANEFNPNNARLNFMIGHCILETIHKIESVKYFERAYELDPNVDEEIVFELAKAYHIKEEWGKAISWYKKYRKGLEGIRTKKNEDFINIEIKLAKKFEDECSIGSELSEKQKRVFIDNVGASVNTEYPEYGPVISADKSVMYFTSRRPGSTGFHDYTKKDAEHDKTELDYYEDIYSTHHFKNGTWSKSKNIGHPINTNGQDATVALTPDGQHMIFYSATIGDGVLYEATLEGEVWSHPEKMDKHFNSKYHDPSACYSLDKKTVYFVSNKPEGNLGSQELIRHHDGLTHDIFYSTWNESKKHWSDPVNLGAGVNTPYNEVGLFLHADGKTLYFSSDGEGTIGGYDIFKTVKKDDGTWSKPQNLGYPINGTGDDVGFVLSADGRTGFYTSEHSDGFGGLDIYMITFLGPEKEVISLSEDNLLASVQAPVSEKFVEPIVEVSSSQTTILKGVVLDAITLEPIEASIDLIDNQKNEKVATFTSNSKTGKFLVSLPSGKNYGIAVLAEGYLFHSENFDIPLAQGFQEINKEVLLKKVAVGTSIVLKNIFFDYDKATLRKESIPELERLINLLKEVPTMKIEISGHTDSRGTDEYNQKLSESRAKSVVAYLIDKGIASKRLQYKGYGESKPVATNDTGDGRQQNRRTEFMILSK